jgi:putative Mn2+ efflux pump MntP
LAVGLSLAFQKVHIWYPAVVIGIVAGILTAVGMNLGKRFGPLLGKRMEVIGGLVQIIIGIKILWEHLGA